MVADRLAQAVRHQLGLGRLLPLGDTPDGAWLVERAAVGALRAAASRTVPNVRLSGLRLALAAPDEAGTPAVPAPPSALPPGPLRIEAEFAATADAPLTSAGEQLRTALLSAAGAELGLRVSEVDLRVTDLLDGTDEEEAPPVAGGVVHGGSGFAAPGADGDGHSPRPGETTEAVGTAVSPGTEEHPPAPADRPHATAAAEAVIAVPGVTRLAPVLGSALGGVPGEGVGVMDRDVPRPGRHLQIQIAVAEGVRALDVARAVRRAAARAAAWDAPESAAPVTVAVLVSAIDPAPGPGGERRE